ncbi:MAG: hypothetical protein WCK26_01900 [Candidatus Saccharibacteria bacterium]
MRYVYHRVPENMIGDVLYPMNRLSDVDEKIYNLYKSGYDGREHLLKREIPYIDCLWNDVIHCCPVHPQRIIDALRKAGVKKIPKSRYFEINIERDLDINDAVIFYRNSEKFGDIRFEKAIGADWNKVDIIPQLTLDYYQEVAKTEEPLFLYQGIPHFLYKGEIKTNGLKIIGTK